MAQSGPRVLRGALSDAVHRLPHGNVVVLSNRTPPPELLNLLRSLGHNLSVFQDLKPNTYCIDKTVQAWDGFGPAVLLALGNPALLDTAKLLRFRHEHRSDTHLVVVPDVPGSADTSPFTQHILHKKNNTTFHLPSLRPDVVVHDPAWCPMEDIPGHGFTTLLQGVEAFVSTHSTEETRQRMLDPLCRLLSGLNGGDHHPGTIYDACAQLSPILGQKGLGLGTSMAAKMSSFLGVPFGHVLAAALPPVMAFNGSAHYRALDHAIGRDTVSCLQDIRWRLGLEKLHALLHRDTFVNHLKELSEMTLGDVLHWTNPRVARLPDIQSLYKEIYFI